MRCQLRERHPFHAREQIDLSEKTRVAEVIDHTAHARPRERHRRGRLAPVSAWAACQSLPNAATPIAPAIGRLNSIAIVGNQAHQSGTPLPPRAVTRQARLEPIAGAIVHDRDRRRRGRQVRRTAPIPTTCWECSTCCGALATVREGRVVDFAPNRDHPYSKGAFCIKGIRGAPGITYGPNRLLHPHAPRRRARRGQVGARLLGRGARRDGRPAGPGAPEVRAGGDRRRHQRRLLQPQRDPGADAALDRLAQLDDQPGPVRRLPRGERARHGPRHHARRGHRQHALRADRRPQPQHRRSGRVGGARRPPRSAARASSSSTPSARRRRRWPICGSPRGSARTPRWRWP